MDVNPHDGSEPGKAFWRLFEYIDGGNSEAVKIPMTAPVTTRIVPGDGAKSNFTRSFYVPSSFQEETPTPMNSVVYLEDRPEMKYVDLLLYVLKFISCQLCNKELHWISI